jgi:copper oxidase (laccase) domain-containing protein
MEMITYKPDTLELNIDINEQNINKYLQHKHQRQNNEGINDMSKLPSNIVSLMQTYGDVIANANKTDVSNYLKYKKYN